MPRRSDIYNLTNRDTQLLMLFGSSCRYDTGMDSMR